MHPFYKIELESYHSLKRVHDSEEKFSQFFAANKGFMDYLVDLICSEEAIYISSCVEYCSLYLKKSILRNRSIDFVFIYRGLANASFDALNASVLALISQGLSVLIIAPELKGLSAKFCQKSPHLFFADSTSLASIAHLLVSRGLPSFKLEGYCSQTLATIISACLCASLDCLSLHSKQIEGSKKIIFCQFGYPGGFLLFIKVLRKFRPDSVLVWHSTKYNSRIFGNNCEYSSGSFDLVFTYMPSLFEPLPLAIKLNYINNRHQRCCILSDLKTVIASSISRSEKLLADPSFSHMIAHFLRHTTSNVKYLLYADHMVNVHSFVNAVCKIYPAARNRIVLSKKFSPNELLRQYESVDFFLDPFPFSAGLTLFRALELSVPVVSLLSPDQYTCSLSRKFYHLLGDSLFRTMSPFVTSPSSYSDRAFSVCELIQSNPDALKKIVGVQDLIFQDICKASRKGMEKWIAYFKSL